MKEPIELTDAQKLEVEEKVIESLLQNGVSFQIPLKTKVRIPSKAALLFNKVLHRKWRDRRIPKSWNVEVKEICNSKGKEKVYMRNLSMDPLYLATIETIRDIRIRIKFDEEKLIKNPIEESNRLSQHTSELAELCAIATVNNTEENRKNRITIAKLKAFYVSHLTPERLLTLVRIVFQMSDPAHFVAAIRHIQETPAPTKPKINLEE